MKCKIPGYLYKGFLFIKYSSTKELFQFLRDSWGTGVTQVGGNFLPRGGRKMADHSKESFLSMQITCYTKHFSYNIPCKHLINSNTCGQPIDITPIRCLAVKLSLSLFVEAATVRAGSCTAPI